MLKSFEQILWDINALSDEEFRAFEEELLNTEVPDDCEFSLILDRIGIEGTLGEWIDRNDQIIENST